MIKISVIIPVYNVEQYLERCLDSVVNQTLKEIEIICVNDCSPDNSLEILKEYATKDKRIKIINFEENKGVAIARNTAINLAQGEYLGFVDSDDYVDLDFYEKLYDKAKAENAELVIGNVIQNKTQTFLQNLTKKMYFDKFNFHQLFWLGLYKTELITKNNIKFIEGCNFGEDRVVPLKSAFLCKNFSYVESTYYHYEKNDNSLTRSKFNQKKMKDFMDSCDAVQKFLNENEYMPKDYATIINCFFEHILSFCLNLENKEQKIFSKYIIKFINNIRLKTDISPHIQMIYNILIKEDNKTFIKECKIISNKITLESLRNNIRDKKGVR